MKLLVIAFQDLVRTEGGVIGRDYALLASFIGVIIFGSVTVLGLQINKKFTTLTDLFNSTHASPGQQEPPPGPIVSNPGSNDTAGVLGDAAGSTTEVVPHYWTVWQRS